MNIEKAITEVVRDYYEAMAYKTIARPRVVLSFSAVPGSGKTTLAQKLKDDLKACYIQADAIRTMLSAKGVDPRTVTISDITTRIAELVFKSDANKFIILDASIDRTWPQFFERVKSEEARPFVIRLNIPDAIIEQQQLKRDGKAKAPEERARFREQFELCRQNVKADVELISEYNYDEVPREIKRKTRTCCGEIATILHASLHPIGLFVALYL